MNPTDILGIALGALRDRKLRSVLTILGIVIGPAAIVGLIGATQGFTSAVTAEFSRLGATTILVTMSGRETLSARDIQSIGKLPQVSEVLPYYQLLANIEIGNVARPVLVYALDPSKLRSLLPDISVAEGRMPASTEYTAAAIGHGIAYPESETIPPIRLNQIVSVTLGQLRAGQPSIGAKSFAIRGILSEFGQGLFVNPDDTIFVTLRAGQLLTGQLSYSGAFIIASSPDAVNLVAADLERLLGENARVLAVSTILRFIQQISGAMATILGAIAFTSVIVAFIGIMTTMFTTVVERTREIGLLKALGFTRRHILLLFLSEATLTGFVGGIVGAGVGTGLSYALVGFFQSFGAQGFEAPRGIGRSPLGREAAATIEFSPVITPELILVALLMATAVAALAGLIPAWRAAKLTPVEALRHE